ncbi:MAG: hypothetical protein LBN03_00820 [Bifidobacteriaceae bacterium]|jgi:hypothetical protein|nr:hypothetical protein [Bifidobacteriaceae bacterium]
MKKNTYVLILNKKTVLTLILIATSFILAAAAIGIQFNSESVYATPAGTQSSALPLSNGGTAQATAAAVRNSMGLGNTTGPLPIANGGFENATGNAVGAYTISAVGTNAGTRKLWYIADDFWDYTIAEVFPTGVQNGDVVIIAAYTGWMRQYIVTDAVNHVAYGWAVENGESLKRIAINGTNHTTYKVSDSSITHW